jgi:hypothetical protein
MAWDDPIFNYCERGHDPSFWAEPLNAASNVAFIVAALLATRELLQRPRGSPGLTEAALVGLVYVIGTGSFLFHTYAMRWAVLADVVPITIFMLAYLAYALRRFMGHNWLLVGLSVVAFYGLLHWAATIECRNTLLPVTARAGARCLNGSAGYSPAFGAMALTGAMLALRSHPAWRYVLGAAAVFLVSLMFRTVDLEWCDWTRAFGHVAGTHFLWHLLNAVTLYLLLVGAIRHGEWGADRRIVLP